MPVTEDHDLTAMGRGAPGSGDPMGKLQQDVREDGPHLDLTSACMVRCGAYCWINQSSRTRKAFSSSTIAMDNIQMLPPVAYVCVFGVFSYWRA